MKNEHNKHRFAGKGYYIALIACIAAVGISGYVFVRTARNSALETMAEASVASSETARTSVSETGKSETPAVSAKPNNNGSTGKPAQTPEAGQTAGGEEDAQTTDLMEDAYEAVMGETPVIQWPIQGDVIATFSRDTLTYSNTMADWRTHEGLDIAAEAGSLVSATQDGTVTAVYEDDFLGRVVVVSHSGDLATLYANLAQETYVAVGDYVLSGEVLGQVGSSALLEAAEPSHLHFEVYENGSPVDPLSYLP